MNYQSGDKKNILGNKLSNRYLSSDAFTSSTGKTGGRSISKLGALFKGHGQMRRFSGTGQKVGLFEIKNIVIKLFFICACISVVLYTVPITRYRVHAFFAKKANIYTQYTTTSSDVLDTRLPGELYVSPVFLQTDRFLVDAVNMPTDVSRTGDADTISSGSFAYASPGNTLVGIIETSSSTRAHVLLFSEVGFKNNFFLKNTDVAHTDEDVSQPDVSTSTSTATDTVERSIQMPNYISASFEGLGYGQLLAKVPPQIQVPVDTILYARTQSGLKPAGRVTYVEKDTGSTFTNVYAQILTPPYALYKIKIEDTAR